MDCRLTLKNDESFVEVLKAAQATAEQVHLLVDENGIERINGFVKSFIGEAPVHAIDIEGHGVVELAKIVAVNGTFASDYSEC